MSASEPQQSEQQRESQQSVSQALQSIGASDCASMTRLWARCFPRLVRVAHATLRHLPHRVEDAQDAAQSALISFWQRLEDRGLDDTLARNSLWALLATITTRKARQIVRREFAAKRGGGDVANFTDITGSTSGPNLSQVLSHIPSTDFDLACEERIAQLPEPLRPFALLRLFGHTNSEISRLLTCSERKVERKLNLIRSYWSQPE